MIFMERNLQSRWKGFHSLADKLIRYVILLREHCIFKSILMWIDVIVSQLVVNTEIIDLVTKITVAVSFSSRMKVKRYDSIFIVMTMKLISYYTVCITCHIYTYKNFMLKVSI